ADRGGPPGLRHGGRRHRTAAPRGRRRHPMRGPVRPDLRGAQRAVRCRAPRARSARRPDGVDRGGARPRGRPRGARAMTPRLRLSVVVVTRNEEERLRACLEAVVWADEIVVVDAESEDKTVAIAQEFTDRVVVRPWPGYAAQKNTALDLATGDWVLSLDADEAVSLEHRSYRDVSDFLMRADRYSTLAAEEAVAQGRRARVSDLLLRPLGRFLGMYVVQGGFLDGWRGFLLATLYAYYVLIRSAKIWERTKG